MNSVGMKSDIKTIFSDLDSTLIFSHRRQYEAEKVWVESLNGNLQSFMTRFSYEYFKTQENFNVIPVTTRTYRQFSRLLDALSILQWHEALICNGAKLLIDGTVDTAWEKESAALSQADMPAFLELLSVVKKRYPESELVIEDPYMFYLKSNDVEKDYHFFKQKADKSHLMIFKDARKVYCIIKCFTKGKAVERYRERYRVGDYIACGDNELDISMFSDAAVAFCPRELKDFQGTEKCKISKDFFPDYICSELIRLGGSGTV